MSHKSYAFAAYPPQGQAQAAARLFGSCRWLWNQALDMRETARKAGEPIPTMKELSAMLPVWKHTPETAWLGEVSSVALQQKLRDLDQAYKNFFDSLTGKRKGKRVNPPRFKKRGNRDTARFTRNSGFKVYETTHGVGFVTLPKIGRIRFVLSRPLPSAPTSVTLIKHPSGRWEVVFVVEVEDQVIDTGATTVAGIDYGLKDLATIARSDGTREKVENPRWLRKTEKKLAREQRILSRKEKGSANWRKQRIRVARAHERVRNARSDHHHKLALSIVRENQTVVLEGVSPSALSRTRMGKSVHDAAWGQLARLIHEKAPTYGCEVITLDRFDPTTRTCSICGEISAPKPLSVRQWECEGCGTVLDRDYNAAVNIMVGAGHAQTLNACGRQVRLTLAQAGAAQPEEAGTHRNDPTPLRAAA